MKMILVVRKDLNMRKGKIAVQTAHAAVCVLLNTMQGAHHGEYCNTEEIDDWLTNSFRKICVYVNSETELLDIVNQANLADIPHQLVIDNGLTEFNNVPTITCCAIGPWIDDELDIITGHLPLL